MASSHSLGYEEGGLIHVSAVGAQEVDVLGYVLSMLGICVVMGLFAGLYAKFISVVLGTLAYPAYLALYGMEFVLAPGSKKERQFFSFNKPKGGSARMTCHFLGATTTCILIAPLSLRVFSAATDLKKQGVFWESAFNGTLFPAPLTITALVCLLVMYAISFFTEVDSKSPMEKIEALSVPSLWKGVLK